MLFPRDTIQAIHGLLFQSLFWWNVLLNLPTTTDPHPSLFVSILVLVECTSEYRARFLFACITRVSILVLVECTSEYGDYTLSECLWFREFQSLFWWNVLLNPLNASYRSHNARVSILVLVECTSEYARRGCSPLCLGRVSILVLVECTSE